MATPPQLRADVQELLIEVERLAGAAVSWEEAPDLGAQMSSEFDDSGCPAIAYRDFSQRGAAEELLHLRLALPKHPDLRGDVTIGGMKDTVSMLANAVHHQIIYPQLEAMGFLPRKAQAKAVARQLDHLEEQWDDDDPRPVYYINKVENGEVLYLNLGHCRGHYDMQPMLDYYPVVERGSWEVPEYYELLRRGIKYCVDRAG